MSTLTKSIPLILSCGLLSTASTVAWEIPLTIEEHYAVGGPRKVTGGVPLLVGQAMDIKDLRLVVKDAKGKVTAMPAQFRELARWWRQDKSLRWVLVDFAANLDTSEKKVCYLTNEGPANPAPDQSANRGANGQA